MRIRTDLQHRKSRGSDATRARRLDPVCTLALSPPATNGSNLRAGSGSHLRTGATAAARAAKPRARREAAAPQRARAALWCCLFGSSAFEKWGTLRRAPARAGRPRRAARNGPARGLNKALARGGDVIPTHCRDESTGNPDTNGTNCREYIETAVVAGGKYVTAPHEAWIVADPFKGGVRVLITGPHGFERTVTFAIDDDPAVIAERVRETLEA
jgi:hypothetical protein